VKIFFFRNAKQRDGQIVIRFHYRKPNLFVASVLETADYNTVLWKLIVSFMKIWTNGKQIHPANSFVFVFKFGQLRSNSLFLNSNKLIIFTNLVKFGKPNNSVKFAFGEKRIWKKWIRPRLHLTQPCPPQDCQILFDWPLIAHLLFVSELLAIVLANC